MTNDLDEVTARLSACLDVVTSTVSDEAPPWDASRPTSSPVPQRSLRPGRSALVVAGAVAAAAVTAVLIWPRGTARADLISATVRTIGAQTARVRLTSVPSAAIQQAPARRGNDGHRCGRFQHPGHQGQLPGWLQLGPGRRPQLADRLATDIVALDVERAPATKPPLGSAAERALEGALEPDTGPDAL